MFKKGFYLCRRPRAKFHEGNHGRGMIEVILFYPLKKSIKYGRSKCYARSERCAEQQSDGHPGLFRNFVPDPSLGCKRVGLCTLSHQSGAYFVPVCKIGWLITTVGYLAGFVFFIIGVINAAGGKMKPLPLIGNFTLIK